MRPDDLELTEIDFQELKKHLVKKEPQNVYDLMDRYQLDVVTRIFFGYSSDSLPATTQTFREAMEVVFNLNTKRIFLGYVSVKVECFGSILRVIPGLSDPMCQCTCL